MRHKNKAHVCAGACFHRRTSYSAQPITQSIGRASVASALARARSRPAHEAAERHRLHYRRTKVFRPKLICRSQASPQNYSDKVSHTFRTACDPVRTFPRSQTNSSSYSSYKHANLRELLANVTSRLLTRRQSLKRSHAHLPVVHSGGKYVVNGNPHTLFLSLLPFLLPEQWEEPTGRSFHSASTVVILEETGREREGVGGGRCVVVYREGGGQIELYASMDPLVYIFQLH